MGIKSEAAIVPVRLPALGAAANRRPAGGL